MLNQLIDRVTKKKWSEAELDAMVGPAQSAWLTYAEDEALRARAASGGTTTALLLHALESGQIDGAIVCKTFIDDGKVRAHFVLARTAEEILDARGSKYVETKFLREVLPILEQNEGRFAICGLPCDITNLRRWETKNAALAAKIVLRIAFLCGHNSRKELIDHITCQLARKAGPDAKLVGYDFRTGHWRGELEARYDNGAAIRKPFAYFSDYRNLYFFAERKCVACMDHFGYDSDISVGDIWLYALRDDPVKHTGILIRTETAHAMFESLRASGKVHAQSITREMILDGQTRIAPVHYNITARSKAGALLGVKLPENKGIKAGPLKVFSAFVGLANMRWSETGGGRMVMAIPRPLVRAYLLFKKGVESIK